MITNILSAFLILGAMGLLFGAVLSVTSKVFEVKEDDRFEQLLETLPGANCGGCGFAGCSVYAQNIVENGAAPNMCPVGGEETAAAIAGIMGIELTKNMRLSAFVKCSGGDNAAKKYEYSGLRDCHAAMLVANGPTVCEYGCLGLGSCVESCRFGALSIKNGVAFVNQDICTGCLRCVETCPKNVIHPVPYNADVNIACSSHQRGASLRKICNIGCLGCRICEKVCEYGAIKVVDNLAILDYEKCVGCGECEPKCPRHLISDAKLDREAAVEAAAN